MCAKRFSERIGVTKRSPSLQMDGMSDELRNSLWNVLLKLFDSPEDGDWWHVAELIATDFLKTPTDELSPYRRDRRRWVKQQFSGLLWYQVYDLIEFIAKRYQYLREKIEVVVYGDLPDVFRIFNKILERELSGYRFAGGELVPISSSTEVAEVNEAVASSRQLGLAGAHKHLRTALSCFGKRPDPDYRNAIKEAISAVESVCSQIEGSKPTGLAGALKKLASRLRIHPALHLAFVKMYGYTSDEDGIRHAILEDADVGFDEAKFMIVSCSAFVNYLIAKSSAADLL